MYESSALARNRAPVPSAAEIEAEQVRRREVYARQISEDRASRAELIRAGVIVPRVDEIAPHHSIARIASLPTLRLDDAGRQAAVRHMRGELDMPPPRDDRETWWRAHRQQ